MKLRRKLAAALCLALVVCVAAIPACVGALAAISVERNASLWVDVSKLTISVGETRDVKLTWKSKTGKLYYSWDNDAVIDFKKSEQWDGYSTTLYVTGRAAGRATVTITNSINADKAMIDVTVIDEGRQQEISNMMGISVKSANKWVYDKLQAVSGGYSNGYVKVVANDFKRIRDITVYATGKRYMLFSIWPGMSYKAATTQLKKLGWKQEKKRGTSAYFLNEDYLCRALCLEKRSGKVASVRYYVP